MEGDGYSDVNAAREAESRAQLGTPSCRAFRASNGGRRFLSRGWGLRARDVRLVWAGRGEAGSGSFELPLVLGTWLAHSYLCLPVGENSPLFAHLHLRKSHCVLSSSARGVELVSVTSDFAGSRVF